jgi:hypothetical protein
MSKADSATADLDLPAHGASTLPSVAIDSYNVEIEDEEGFVGDKASKSAFWEIVDKWRKLLQKVDEDPLGRKASEKIGRQKFAELLASGEPKAAAVVASAVEEYAQELASVIRRYMRLKDWRKTECIVIGGGFSGSRLGQLAVARAELLLRAEGVSLDLDIIHNDPDEAGLLGAVHLLPPWMLKGHKGMLAVDLGGTNFRAGVVSFGKHADLAQARVVRMERWRHADEDVTRDKAMAKLVRMLRRLMRWSDKDQIELAPLVGVACPGLIDEDGAITRGGQNLPGNWESRRFNVPALIRSGLPTIGKDETLVVMHNDAVVQGLSELPRVKNRKRWGVLTIGTGLGNARYTNRKPNGGKS